jgi:cyclic pyranopterin phosphate synthase
MSGKTRLSHVSRDGKARMVDVSGKIPTQRSAIAEAWVDVGAGIARKVRASGGLAKGNVLETARLAGILAAKQTPNLIPMCHPLPLESIELEARVVAHRVRIVARVACQGRTGVEMEAMTAASIAALTVYDMVKSAGKGVQIGPIRLLEKRGGKSGHWRREAGDGQG